MNTETQLSIYCIVLVVFGKGFECAHKIKCGRYLFTRGVNFFFLHEGLHATYYRKRVNSEHSLSAQSADVIDLSHVLP